MIIYASPKSGKSTFVKNNPGWLDSDVYLFDQFKQAFGVEIKDDNTKGEQIIALFKKDRALAENVYTSLMYWLQRESKTSNILLGSRRFMWMADHVFIKDTNNRELLSGEVQSALKWNIKYIALKKNEYIDEYLSKLIEA